MTFHSRVIEASQGPGYFRRGEEYFLYRALRIMVAGMIMNHHDLRKGTVAAKKARVGEMVPPCVGRLSMGPAMFKNAMVWTRKLIQCRNSTFE